MGLKHIQNNLKQAKKNTVWKRTISCKDAKMLVNSWLILKVIQTLGFQEIWLNKLRKLKSNKKPSITKGTIQTYSSFM